MCHKYFGHYLPVAGNIGIFCQTDKEFIALDKIRKEITSDRRNPLQKYYPLFQPIIASFENTVPSANYKWLYIRKPDPTPYGLYLGDIDFVVDEKKYMELKEAIAQNKFPEEVKLYNQRPGWNMIQLTDPSTKSVAYIGTELMTEKVRTKFD